MKAVEYALVHKGAEVFNLGTGTPYRVTEIVESLERSTGVEIKYVCGERRLGDLTESYVNVDKALNVLGWKAEKTLEDMCRDTCDWQSKNPNGYKKYENVDYKEDGAMVRESIERLVEAGLYQEEL